jgi:hypothetical protein
MTRDIVLRVQNVLEFLRANIRIRRTCFIALAIKRSDSPLEYTFAVSQVVTPRSQAALSSGKAC